MVDFLRPQRAFNEDNGQSIALASTGQTAEFMWITPEMAMDWLERQEGNRSVSDDHVAKFRRDMEASRWHIVPQGIGLDENGMVVDGQHRLWAIVLSRITQELLVVRGITREASKAIDETRKRTLSDDLKREGEKDYPVKAAAARLIAKTNVAWSRGVSFNTMVALQFNRYELDDTLQAVKERANLDAAIRSGSRIRSKHKCPSSPATAAHCLSELAYGPDFTEDFFYRVEEMIGLQPKDPEKALIARFEAEAGKKPKAVGDLYLAWILRALAYSHSGQKVTRIEFKGRFPEKLPQL